MSDITSIINRVYGSLSPDRADLKELLSISAGEELDELFSFADKVRRDFCGDGIVLRGIIEFSSFCDRECFYCGLNRGNHKLKRYRMDKDGLFRSVAFLASRNIRTVVLQSGEDAGIGVSWLAEIIRRIKSDFDIAVTLSVGERDKVDYKAWKEAGADRYLLKMETCNEALYSSMHPEMSFRRRLDCLDALKECGYQVGSGNIVGLPGQTLGDIAEDIIFFKRNDFDMIGIGPFIPHQESRFSGHDKGDAALTLKTVALTRIVTRNAHIPATTALGSLDKDYRVDGLKCGANVLMPNFTPQPYRSLYEIYPQKRCFSEPPGSCDLCMEDMAGSLGRFIDYSKADSLKIKEGA
jgi:biotin synthase